MTQSAEEMLKDRFGLTPTSTKAGVPVWPREKVDQALGDLLGRQQDKRIGSKR